MRGEYLFLPHNVDFNPFLHGYNGWGIENPRAMVLVGILAYYEYFKRILNLLHPLRESWLILFLPLRVDPLDTVNSRAPIELIISLQI